MLDTYMTTQAVAIRRQAATRRDVASLRRLLHELSRDSDRVTRDFWLGLWDRADVRWTLSTATLVS
jgi:hypothetical protein